MQGDKSRWFSSVFFVWGIRTQLEVDVVEADCAAAAAAAAASSACLAKSANPHMMYFVRYGDGSLLLGRGSKQRCRRSTRSAPK